MLDVFVADNREEILRRCRTKVETRSNSTPTAAKRHQGLPQFLDQLVDALQNDRSSASAIDASAILHGQNLRLQGSTVSQVVHDYGDVCQSITDLALQLHAPISVDEFRTLNRCLDDAIAVAVTEHARGTQSIVDADAARHDERLGMLVHEIRNLVSTACVAFEVLRTGDVGVGGSTGRVLQRSLSALRDLINRSVDEVRLRHDGGARSQFELADFIQELASAASLEAGARGLSFHVEGVDVSAVIDADRPVLAAVVMNLLQNAFKFTRPGSNVTLRGSATAERVLIEVEDECGGLPDGTIAGLFQPFEQRSADRTGLGLGLAICRWGTEVNDGRISARSLAGHGCIFTVDLPRPTLLRP